MLIIISIINRLKPYHHSAPFTLRPGHAEHRQAQEEARHFLTREILRSEVYIRVPRWEIEGMDIQKINIHDGFGTFFSTYDYHMTISGYLRGDKTKILGEVEQFPFRNVQPSSCHLRVYPTKWGSLRHLCKPPGDLNAVQLWDYETMLLTSMAWKGI